MAQRISVALVSIPTGSRDLIEFAFFIAIGFTAGSLGLIWIRFYCNSYFNRYKGLQAS